MMRARLSTPKTLAVIGLAAMECCLPGLPGFSATVDVDKVYCTSLRNGAQEFVPPLPPDLRGKMQETFALSQRLALVSSGHDTLRKPEPKTCITRAKAPMDGMIAETKDNKVFLYDVPEVPSGKLAVLRKHEKRHIDQNVRSLQSPGDELLMETDAFTVSIAAAFALALTGERAALDAQDDIGAKTLEALAQMYDRDALVAAIRKNKALPHLVTRRIFSMMAPKIAHTPLYGELSHGLLQKGASQPISDAAVARLSGNSYLKNPAGAAGFLEKLARAGAKDYEKSRKGKPVQAAVTMAAPDTSEEHFYQALRSLLEKDNNERDAAVVQKGLEDAFSGLVKSGNLDHGFNIPDHLEAVARYGARLKGAKDIPAYLKPARLATLDNITLALKQHAKPCLPAPQNATQAACKMAYN